MLVIALVYSILSLINQREMKYFPTSNFKTWQGDQILKVYHQLLKKGSLLLIKSWVMTFTYFS